MGSIEYAIDHLDIHLIVVMGHESCGAVGAAMSLHGFHGDVGFLVDKVKDNLGSKNPSSVYKTLNDAV